MRGFLFGLMVASGVLVGSAGCGKVSSSSGGSNTNWLERCASDADCGSGSQCWCNACTTSCASDGDCDGGGCRTTDALGCGVPGVGTLCVATCVNDGDCLGFGSELACRGGACLPATGSSMDGVGGGAGGVDASGGSGGSGASGGTAGTSGGPPLGPRSRTSFGVSTEDTCVVTAGQIHCWGSNLYGQLGSPPEMRVDAPRLVGGLTDVASIALNGEHTCALTTGGDVYCWGLNDVGQTGGPSAPEDTCPDYVLDRPGGYACQPTPTRVEGVSGATAVVVGDGVSCALLAETVQCWGDVPDGFLELATEVTGLTKVSGFDFGTGGGCVWGPGASGCSNGLDYSPLIPTQRQDTQLGDSPNAAEGFGCVLGSIGGGPGNVVCFGDNHFGQLGYGGFLEVEAVTVIGDTKSIALGDAHACALGNDEKVRCWGRNTTGAVGPAWLASVPCGWATCEPSPVEVPGLPPIAAINAGGDRTCAFGTDGTLWCWGADAFGLGAPVRLSGPWETHGDVCGPLVNQVTQSRYDAFVFTENACVTDEDCVEVPLDLLSCDRTCAAVALPRALADSVAMQLAQLDADSCPEVRELGCQTPPIACPDPTTRAVCEQGNCMRADPAHSGCTDQCACSAERGAASLISLDDCDGFDLSASGRPCPSCEEGAAYVVVMNRGSAPFSGDAVISWDAVEDGAATLPEPMTTTLALEPGTISAAIRVPSRAAGTALVRVTADGDCNPTNDALYGVIFPSPNAGCD